MAFLHIIRRLFFGFIWYLVLINLMGFLLTLTINVPLWIMGNEYAGHLGLEAYAKNKWWMITVAIGLAVFGTLKGVLPGTQVVWPGQLMIGKVQTRAAALGFLVYFGLSLGLGLVFTLLWFEITVLIMGRLAVQIIAAIAGGYTAGRIAKESQVLNGASVGVPAMIGWIFYSASYPLWFNVIVFAGAIPFAALGGYLAKVKK